MHQFITLFLITGLITGCTNTSFSKNESDAELESRLDKRFEGVGSFFGKNALSYRFTQNHQKQSSKKEVNSAIPSYLWDAVKQSLDFMSIDYEDQKKGTILTDWHQINANERIKVMVNFNTTAKNEQPYEVICSRQIKENHQWKSTSPSKTYCENLVNTIQDKAKLLKAQQN